MNQKKINTILISDSEINHIIYSIKKDEFIIEGCSYFSINPFDKSSLNNAFSEISQYVKNNKLTKLNIINDHVLKYKFILNQNETANLRFEALNRFKTTFDIQLNDYYIDFETYNFKNMTLVFIAGINKPFFDSILRHLKSQKFKLLFAEIDIMALKRLISYNYPGEVVMNIHLRDDKTIFTVMSDETLFAFRELNFGFKNIIKYLYEETKLEESIILEKLNFEDLPLAKALDKFTIELQRTIDFYNSQFRNIPISKLVLTGKILNINGIDKFLSQLFLINTEKFNSLKQFFINTDIQMIENMTYLSEILGTSLREI